MFGAAKNNIEKMVSTYNSINNHLITYHFCRITVKNRRYGAMQRLRKSGDYFSEKEMERRNPLLYDHLIGKHMTAEERKEKYTVEKYEAR